MDTTSIEDQAATLLPPKARAVVYVLTVMFGAGFAAASVYGELPAWLKISYAGWNAGAAVLARVNVNGT